MASATASSTGPVADTVDPGASGAGGPPTDADGPPTSVDAARWPSAPVVPRAPMRSRAAGSVRFRLTASVVLVVGLTLLGGGALLVKWVEATLVNDLRARNERILASMSASISQNRVPSELFTPIDQVQMNDQTRQLFGSTENAEEALSTTYFYIDGAIPDYLPGLNADGQLVLFQRQGPPASAGATIEVTARSRHDRRLHDHPARHLADRWHRAFGRRADRGALVGSADPGARCGRDDVAHHRPHARPGGCDDTAGAGAVGHDAGCTGPGAADRRRDRRAGHDHERDAGPAPVGIGQPAAVRLRRQPRAAVAGRVDPRPARDGAAVPRRRRLAFGRADRAGRGLAVGAPRREPVGDGAPRGGPSGAPGRDRHGRPGHGPDPAHDRRAAGPVRRVGRAGCGATPTS